MNTNETKGHRLDDPGLRGHSVGRDYPFSVVGLGRDDGGIDWAVQNLKTGVWHSSRTTCEHAHGIAAALKIAHPEA